MTQARDFQQAVDAFAQGLQECVTSLSTGLELRQPGACRCLCASSLGS